VKHILSAGFRFTVELIVVIVVIATVVSLLLSTATESLKRVDVIAATAEVLGGNKTALSVFYALKGEWPKDQQEIDTILFISKRDGRQQTDLVDNVIIRNGALDVSLRRRLSGQIITIHPAVPVDNPLGPVKWVVGANSISSGWKAAGEDRTTVESELIPGILKP